MPEQMMTFAEALAECAGETKHVLLGNGFSRALFNDIFAYEALFLRADFAALDPKVREAFGALGTMDFEVVMKSLRNAGELVNLYQPEQAGLVERFRRDAIALREVLAQTVADNHPARPSDVPTAAYSACRTFLSHFEKVYTLNYDLLLYWTMMRSEVPPSIPDPDDGFRQPEDGPAEYVNWNPSESKYQRIFYLHGALHLFDAGAILKKMTWVNTGLALIDQVRAALAQNYYPLVVSEGTTDEKKDRIFHSGYLTRGYRSFADIAGALFTFGFAMSENDDHWLRCIGKGKTKVLAVGLYGDPASDANRRIRQRAAALPGQRAQRKPLRVIYYGAASASVWG